MPGIGSDHTRWRRRSSTAGERWWRNDDGGSGAGGRGAGGRDERRRGDRPAGGDRFDAGPAAVGRYLEFFAGRIANARTRATYGRAVGQFLGWCEARGLRLGGRLAPTVKQHLAAIRMLGDWLVVSQVVPLNPAAAVRGPKHVVTKGATPVLSTAGGEEAPRVDQAEPRAWPRGSRPRRAATRSGRRGSRRICRTGAPSSTRSRSRGTRRGRRRSSTNRDRRHGDGRRDRGYRDLKRGRRHRRATRGIPGTLFERGLDLDKRAQLAVHYTDWDKITLLVDRPSWTRRSRQVARRLNEAERRYRAFLNRLRGFTVLDPACGSANFPLPGPAGAQPIPRGGAGAVTLFPCVKTRPTRSHAWKHVALGWTVRDRGRGFIIKHPPGLECSYRPSSRV